MPNRLQNDCQNEQFVDHCIIMIAIGCIVMSWVFGIYIHVSEIKDYNKSLKQMKCIALLERFDDAKTTASYKNDC